VIQVCPAFLETNRPSAAANDLLVNRAIVCVCPCLAALEGLPRTASPGRAAKQGHTSTMAQKVC
jgi:hypothetical protein